MAQNAPQPTGSGREIALLVGVLLIVGAATIGTYWIRSRAEASGKQPPVTSATTAETPRPRVSVPAPTEGEVVHADIYFDFKSVRLRADAVRLLEDKAGLMERSSTWGVMVQGYADRQGPPEYNKRLAQQRAEAVKQFLVELGVPEASIKVVTIGQEGALCDDASRECQQLNRRVHLEIRRLPRAAAAPVGPALAVGDVLQTTTGAERP